jgi:hypothetical protein
MPYWIFHFFFITFRFGKISFRFVSFGLISSNSDGSNTMDGSNLFESLANFPYIFKLNKIFRSNTDTSNSRT